MSVENVKAFLAKVKGDKALQAKLADLVKKRKAFQEAEAAEIVKIAADAGFEFTKEHLAEHGNQAVGELSDDQLKAIAGGAYPTPVNDQITDSVTQT